MGCTHRRVHTGSSQRGGHTGRPRSRTHQINHVTASICWAKGPCDPTRVTLTPLCPSSPNVCQPEFHFRCPQVTNSVCLCSFLDKFEQLEWQAEFKSPQNSYVLKKGHRTSTKHSFCGFPTCFSWGSSPRLHGSVPGSITITRRIDVRQNVEVPFSIPNNV